MAKSRMEVVRSKEMAPSRVAVRPSPTPNRTEKPTITTIREKHSGVGRSDVDLGGDQADQSGERACRRPFGHSEGSAGPGSSRWRGPHRARADSNNDDEIDQDVERVHVSVVAESGEDQAGKDDTEKS